LIYLSVTTNLVRMQRDYDPQIRISDALAAFDGNKAALARHLGLHRVALTTWTRKQGREYLPALHAYRLQRTHPAFYLCGPTLPIPD
jgi:hypothetical protein